ncbi:MAG: NADH-quinone oxidoreductase subunit J [Deltaproteobacteria bacterium]|nr:NADH-quinone oxidoreductase subunit J [Deltaproteobacteria bacterium]
MKVPLLSAMVFWAFAILAMASAVFVAFSRNIVHAAFALLGCFFGVAGLYLFLSADFVGIIQVMVYVGGVLILFLFAVMLTGKIRNPEKSNPSRAIPGGLVTMLVTLGLFGYLAFTTPWQVLPTVPTGPTTSQIGDALLGPYILPFEVASVLLLAALLGGVLLAGGVRGRSRLTGNEQDEAPRDSGGNT